MTAVQWVKAVTIAAPIEAVRSAWFPSIACLNSAVKLTRIEGDQHTGTLDVSALLRLPGPAIGGAVPPMSRGAVSVTATADGTEKTVVDLVVDLEVAAWFRRQAERVVFPRLDKVADRFATCMNAKLMSESPAPSRGTRHRAAHRAGLPTTGSDRGLAPTLPSVVLVVDFGTTTTAANLIDADDRVHPVTDPLSGARVWPTCVHHDGTELAVGSRADERKQEDSRGFREELKMDLGGSREIPLGDASFSPITLVAGLLKAVRVEAERIAGAPVLRVLVTVPGDWRPGDQRRRDLESACREAGFEEVEFLYEPVAAAYAAQVDGLFAAGETILVHDLGGGSFDLALVELGGAAYEVVPTHSVPDRAGRQIDQSLVELLRDAHPGDDAVDAQAVRHELLDVARRLKSRVGVEATAARRSWLGTFRLTTEQLEKSATELIAETVATATAFAQGEGNGRFDGVLLAGGATRMPLVEQAVRDAFAQVPVRRAPNPELAVIDGATAWRRRAAERHVDADPADPHAVPLRWTIPGDVAELSRWLVEPGRRFAAGDPLVRVRLVDGAHWELRARHAGTVMAQHAAVGRRVETGEWLVTVTT